MLPRSLYFLPAWQRNKRDPNHFTVDSREYRGIYYCPSRCGHNAVCVNEDLIIWGGYSEPFIGHSSYCEHKGLWVYNLDNDFWFSVKTEGELPPARSGAASVFIWPHLYIIGGHADDGNVNDVHALNLITLQWNKMLPIHPGLSKRDKATAWSWQNRIYVFGGYGTRPYHDLWDQEDGDVFTIEAIEVVEGCCARERIMDRGWNNQVVYLDLDSMAWIRPNIEGTKPLSRAAHTSTLVGNSVYIFGGRHRGQRMNDLHRLDLECDRWNDNIVCLGQLPCGRSWHSMTKQNSSHLLLFGGYDMNNIPLEDAWLLNIDTYSWQVLTRKTGFPRLWHTASVNSHGDILVFGGCTSDITNHHITIDTSDKVVLFKTQPFSLQRLCLHNLYNNRKLTEHLWDHLPRDFREWLHNRCQFSLDMRPDFYEHTAELGFGPSLSALSVMSLEEATRLNEAKGEMEVDSQ